MPHFVAALRAASLAAAASSLGVDRTTVARRLGDLEERLGVTLFVRRRGGVRPTEAALRMRESAELILRELRGLETRARGADPSVRGVVRIAIAPGLASVIVRCGLLALATRHPDLSLELVAGNAAVELRRGDVDLAFRTFLVREEGVRVRKVAGSAVGLHASPDYLRRRGAPASLPGLAGHDLLVPGGELSRLPEARLLARVAGARVVLRANNLPILVEAATAGHGIVPVVESWGELVGLVRVIALPDIPRRPLWLAIAPGQRERPAVRVVADEIVRLFAEVA